MSGDGLAIGMRSAATLLLQELDEKERAVAVLRFEDEAARRWLEYRPLPRPGACLATLAPGARKAAHRLLSTALSEHAYAQAMVIVALEEVLDREEDGRLGRHSGDYWVSIFGDPQDDGPWSWRFEGHHLSVSVTVTDDQVSPSPVFLGANPARVSYAGRPISRPLAPEEDLARELLDALGPAGRSAAVVGADAPADIRTGTAGRVRQAIAPLGVPSGSLRPGPRAMLHELAGLYLARLRPELAAREADRVAASELHFAWEGSLDPGTPHYYRVQGDDLLVEYDNTSADGNHAHTVLRRPRGDFGGDILTTHYRAAHTSEGQGTDVSDEDPAGRARAAR